MNKKELENLLEKLEIQDLDRDSDFIKENIKVRIIEDILKAMEEEDISKAELARRIGKTKQYISRILNENANFTLESLVDFALALGRTVSISFVKSSPKINAEHNYESYKDFFSDFQLDAEIHAVA